MYSNKEINESEYFDLVEKEIKQFTKYEGINEDVDILKLSLPYFTDARLEPPDWWTNKNINNKLSKIIQKVKPLGYVFTMHQVKYEKTDIMNAKSPKYDSVVYAKIKNSYKVVHSSIFSTWVIHHKMSGNLPYMNKHYSYGKNCKTGDVYIGNFKYICIDKQYSDIAKSLKNDENVLFLILTIMKPGNGNSYGSYPANMVINKIKTLYESTLPNWQGKPTDLYDYEYGFQSKKVKILEKEIVFSEIFIEDRENKLICSKRWCKKPAKYFPITCGRKEYKHDGLLDALLLLV